MLDKAISDKLYKDVQSYRLITVATLVDRLKINGSLARQALADLEEKGQIKKVVGHSKLSIYSESFLYLFFFSFTFLGLEKGGRGFLHFLRACRFGVWMEWHAGAVLVFGREEKGEGWWEMERKGIFGGGGGFFLVCEGR